MLNTSTNVKAVTKLFLLSNDTSEGKFHLTLTTISEGRELISSETRGCLILKQKASRRTIHVLCAMLTRGIFRCEGKHHSKHFSQVFDDRTDDAAFISTWPILFGNCKKISKLDIGVKFPERRLFKNGK